MVLFFFRQLAESGKAASARKKTTFERRQDRFKKKRLQAGIKGAVMGTRMKK